jgi:hypothetical protein
MGEHVDPQLLEAWDKITRLHEQVENLRERWHDASKCIADLRTISIDPAHPKVIVTAIQERLDEYYAGT